MKEYKIDLSMYEGKVRELVSEAIQRHAFELGYDWRIGKEIICEKSPYLFFYKSSNITHLAAEDVRYFEDNRCIKISAADFLAIAPEDVRDKPKEPKEPELKAFQKVLVRDHDSDVWTPNFYYRRNENLTFIHRTVGDVGYHQCIPYEGNEHLLGTTEDVE